MLVDFWAVWCGPCQIVAPVLEQLAGEYAGRVKVVKLDVDTNQRTSMKFNVRSIPSILFFKDGKHVDTVVGAVPKPVLEGKIKQHLGEASLTPMATLYVVATPLGNLADLSPRAADCLRRVAVVAAEDTRRTRGLLAHLDARPQLLSFHAHSPPRRTEMLLEILAAGRDVALVTDAGTPGVSDPGPELVAAARKAGFPVVPLPGASAVTTALSASGFPADRYLFLGFVPRKGGERTRLLAQACAEEWTVVCFEAPSRLAALLQDLRRDRGRGTPGGGRARAHQD